MSTLERVLAEALGLPSQERVRLASELLASLGPPEDADARTDEEWIAEIERRASEAETTPGRPWPEVRAEIERRLPGR